MCGFQITDGGMRIAEQSSKFPQSAIPNPKSKLARRLANEQIASVAVLIVEEKFTHGIFVAPDLEAAPILLIKAARDVFRRAMNDINPAAVRFPSFGFSPGKLIIGFAHAPVKFFLQKIGF